MSSPKEKPRAKLIISVMYAEEEKSILTELIIKLENQFGKIEEKSSEYDFNFTSFYEKEFGNNLKKQYFCFGLFDIEKLPEAKLFCYDLENQYLKNKKRIINIDPGYLTSNSLVLASFKPRAHRIYLKEGVYADLELVYENNEWKGFSWTFPDMKSEKIKEFLNKIKSF